ncbi:hypothetical protein GGTG_13599 [Gaeumannomyces tritici R3-111a-1]|uniref:Uncharacterized protein n=1 Tax=Gaeumannomyces tritici (strain R3-111a-1) TaxID=644352 RepID=J3PJB7_GAET3|nr:hypothetical protein GGTG_13599 [Gaeumannomyces tritici R3-111a-1]EJT68847.1 hypothetical protein GGTG_13599 [Gaeumannomyces tritici R3-111a-1]
MPPRSIRLNFERSHNLKRMRRQTAGYFITRPSAFKGEFRVSTSAATTEHLAELALNGP